MGFPWFQRGFGMVRHRQRLWPFGAHISFMRGRERRVRAGGDPRAADEADGEQQQLLEARGPPLKRWRPVSWYFAPRRRAFSMAFSPRFL